MLINFSLNTFIKICLLDTGQRITEIQKRLSGGTGYDFYQSVQKAVRLYAAGKPDEAINILDAPANAVERRYNQEAFNRFEAKFGGSRSILPISFKRTLTFPNDGISISVDPLFEITSKESQNAYALWTTQSPPLSQRYGAVACQIMRRANANGSLGNKQFLLCDLVNNKTYSEKQITNNTSLILAADVSSIGQLLKQL